MEELLEKLNTIIQKQLFTTTEELINKLEEIGIKKQNIKIYTINDKTEINILVEELEKMITIIIRSDKCNIL